jgi:ABC-2 type transport system permease protein
MLFGYALTVDVKNVSMAVYDQDRSTLSRRFVEEFSHTEYLRVRGHVSGYDEIDELIDREHIAMALVIPAGFERRYISGKSVEVQLVTDGSDATTATVAIGYASSIITNFNLDLKIRELARSGIRGPRMPVDVRSRIWYNPELESKNFIIPGLIVLILAIISALIASSPSRVNGSAAPWRHSSPRRSAGTSSCWESSSLIYSSGSSTWRRP